MCFPVIELSLIALLALGLDALRQSFDAFQLGRCRLLSSRGIGTSLCGIGIFRPPLLGDLAGKRVF